MPLSGGEYTYTREAFGDLIGFLVFFSAMFVQRVSAMAIGSLTFANYLLYPLLSACDNQATAIKITAILCLRMQLHSLFQNIKTHSLHFTELNLIRI